METAVILLGLYLLASPAKPRTERAARVVPANEQFLNSLLPGRRPRVPVRTMPLSRPSWARVDTRPEAAPATQSNWVEDVDRSVRATSSIVRTVTQVTNELRDAGAFREDDITYTKD